MQPVNTKNKNKCKHIYVASVDPKGSIPQRVVNYCAPAQGMMAKEYRDNIDKVKELLEKQRELKKTTK